MSAADEHEWIYDWNRINKVSPISRRKFELLDETLRDGIQSPSVTDPTIDEKLELIHGGVVLLSALLTALIAPRFLST